MQTMTAQERKKNEWLDTWKQHSQRFAHFPGNTETLNYIVAMLMLQNYSCANPAPSDSSNAFFAGASRFFSGKWGNNHGASVAKALKDFIIDTCDNPPDIINATDKLLQMITAIKTEVGDKTLNRDGDLYAILSVIGEQCELRILGEDDKIVFNASAHVPGICSP